MPAEPAASPEAALARLVVHVIGPDARPVSGAKVGTGLNIFESSSGHPPQTIVMWLRGNQRQWPFRSDENGRVVLTGADTVFRQFYVLHEGRALVGWRAVEAGLAKRELTIMLEPACRVHGRLTSEHFKHFRCPLLETVAFVFDADRRQMMYFVSERGQFEFYLPAGQYHLEAEGNGPNGARTQRVQKSFVVGPGQRDLDLGVTDLQTTRLAWLFGQRAPELDGVTAWLNGDAVTLEQLRGRPVVLTFWGTWCKPCLRTMPVLIAAQEEFDRWGVAFISIHDNTIETAAELEAKLARLAAQAWHGKPLPFPVALDAGRSGGRVHRLYGVKRWPTTLLIGRDGNLIGEFDLSGGLQEQLRGMLATPANAK